MAIFAFSIWYSSSFGLSSKKLSIRLIHVSTRFGIASGKAFATKMNIVKLTIPAPIIIPRYRIGYCPMKTNIHTIEKIKAVVEKFAGSTNAKTAKTGALAFSKYTIYNGILRSDNNKNIMVNVFIICKYREVPSPMCTAGSIGSSFSDSESSSPFFCFLYF